MKIRTKNPGPPCREAQPVLEPELKCKGIKLASMWNIEGTDLIVLITGSRRMSGHDSSVAVGWGQL